MTYYPLNKITPNLFTSGNEFRNKQTGQDYKGYYFSTYDGKIFTEKTPISTSTELVRYGGGKATAPTISSADYVNSISTDIPASSSINSHYTPIPTPEDYVKGYFTRYVIRRVNGDASTVIELSQEGYKEIQDNPLYKSIRFDWKISGVLEDTPLPNKMSLPGVATWNRSTISLAGKYLLGIEQYLTNPIQFYK